LRRIEHERCERPPGFHPGQPGSTGALSSKREDRETAERGYRARRRPRRSRASLIARYEYRVVLTAGDDGDDYAWIDYGDSLVGVVLGERVPPWQRPGAIEACSKIEAKLGRMIWDNGRHT
jgi:hypothetical protein